MRRALGEGKVVDLENIVNDFVRAEDAKRSGTGCAEELGHLAMIIIYITLEGSSSVPTTEDLLKELQKSRKRIIGIQEENDELRTRAAIDDLTIRELEELKEESERTVRELKEKLSRAVEELNLEGGAGRSVALFCEPWNGLPKRGPVTEKVWSRAKWLINALDAAPMLAIRTFAFQSVSREVPELTVQWEAITRCFLYPVHAQFTCIVHEYVVPKDIQTTLFDRLALHHSPRLKSQRL